MSVISGIKDAKRRATFGASENSASISFLLRPRRAIEVALQPATVIESPSGLANHRTSIAIRRYPERFVCAIASGARERSHLLLLQHARKKARDNYYGEYASPLSLSSLSFHPVATSSVPVVRPPLSYTLYFPRLPPIPSKLLLLALLFLSFSSFRGNLRGQRASKCFEKFATKGTRSREDAGFSKRENNIVTRTARN